MMNDYDFDFSTYHIDLLFFRMQKKRKKKKNRF